MSEHTHNLWDILVGSNLLNVIILGIAMIYLGNKYLPKIIDERKKQISKEIKDAKIAKAKANEELKIIEEKTRNLELEVKEIKEEAKETANSLKQQMQEEAEKELGELKLKVKREISTKYEDTLQDIKKSAAHTALKLAEETLNELSRDKSVQKKLADDFLVELKLKENKS